MRLAAAGFSERGARLALAIAQAFDGEAWASPRYAGGEVRPIAGSLVEWAGRRFADCEALVFVSSCGIAVRAIAPHIKSKTTDPAVIVTDELGQNVISLLSGHLGGANRLTAEIAALSHGRAVITTATDVHGLTPPDSWAAEHNCAIENLTAAKAVAAELIAGRGVGVAVTEELIPTPYPVTLLLRPRRLFLGTGAKRDISTEEYADCFEKFMEESGYSPLSVAAIASVDAKMEEPAIKALAEKYKIPFETFSAEELMALPGSFTPSPRAVEAVGCDNVCERAALAASRGGYMVRLKTKYPGITFALAGIRRNKNGN